jgi:hypothetical protein
VIVPGVPTQVDLGSSGGGSGAYTVPGAVTFDGATSAKINSIPAFSGNSLSAAGWFKTTWGIPPSQSSAGNTSVLFVIDPISNYLPEWNGGGRLTVAPNIRNAFSVGDISGSSPFVANRNAADGSGNPIAPANPAVWQHWAWGMQSNFAAGGKLVNLFINGIPFAPTTITDTHPSFAIAWNGGVTLWIGDDGASTPSFRQWFYGDVAELSVWPGVLITSSNIGKFIDGSGKPVNPALAITAFGSPAILFSGGASSFLANSLGTYGAASVMTGALTNAPTVPM